MNLRQHFHCLLLAILGSASCQVSATDLTTSEQIQRLYIGYLGRAADGAGLEYWTNEVDNGAITVDQIRINIVNEQPEYLENYGQLSNTELAIKVYQNLLNREPDQAGLDYWVNELETGSIAPEDLIIAYINGISSAEDEQVMANKLTAAECYTSHPGIYSADNIEKIITELDSSASYSQCPPVADAGENQSFAIGESAQVAGFGVDLESTVTYQWRQIYGPTIEVGNTEAAALTFTAPDVSQCISEPLVFELKVTDDAGAVGTDTVQVNITRDFPGDSNSLVEMQTNLGTVNLELFDSTAPVTASNFMKYVDASFYDEKLFHRVIPNFVVQAGLVTSDYRTVTTGLLPAIENEASNGLSNLRGTIAMARTSNPDSAQAQFFINQADNTMLDYQEGGSAGYAVFGQVTSGIEVIDAMVAVETTTVQDGQGIQYQDFPVDPIIIESVSCYIATDSSE